MKKVLVKGLLFYYQKNVYMYNVSGFDTKML